MNKIKLGKTYKNIVNGKTYFKIDVRIISETEEIKKSFSRMKKYEVEEAAEEFIAKYKDINLSFNSKSTVAEAYKNWIYTIKKPSVSSSTFEKYEVLYRNRLKNTKLGNTELLNVTSLLVQNHINELMLVDTDKTCNEFLTRIKSFFKYCKSEQIINYNPTLNISVKLKRKNSSIEAYTLKEQNVILNTLDYNNPVDLTIYISLVTGLRLGECLALEWSDINLSSNTINVNKQVKRNININLDGTRKRGVEVSDLKTINSYREVPILQSTSNILKTYRKKQAQYILSVGNQYKNNSIVLADQLGNHLEKKRPTRRLKKLCEENNIEYKTFHALRHTYITRLFEKNVNAKTVQKIVGHSDIQTTLNIYTHVNNNIKQEAVEKLNDIFVV